MLRRTSVSLMLPALPLYKLSMIALRQVSRPISNLLVGRANQYPIIRRGLIHVGWMNFRIKVHLQRIIFGMEAKAIHEKELKQQMQEELQNNIGVVGSSSSSNQPDKKILTSEIGEKITSSSSPLTAAASTASASSIKSTPIITVGSTQKEKIASEISSTSTTNKTSSSTSKTPTTTKEKQQQHYGWTPQNLRNISTPRAMKVLPTALNPLRIQPLKHVRKIFVSPTRPSDDELLATGMKLVVEFFVFAFFAFAIGYELHLSHTHAAEEEDKLEKRFQRLERHLFDSDADSSSSSSTSTTSSSGKDSTTAVIKKTTTTVELSSETRTDDANTNHEEEQVVVAKNNNNEQNQQEQEGEQQQQLPKQTLFVEKKVTVTESLSITSVGDVVHFMFKLPFSVQFFFICVFAVPYATIIAIIMKLNQNNMMMMTNAKK